MSKKFMSFCFGLLLIAIALPASSRSKAVGGQPESYAACSMAKTSGMSAAVMRRRQSVVAGLAIVRSAGCTEPS